MLNIYIILNLLIGNIPFIYGHPDTKVMPENTHIVDYSSVYSKEPNKCIITNNTKPKPGSLLNVPYLGSCNEYKADLSGIQLPANTYPMCSLDPNWLDACLPCYISISSKWYQIDPEILEKEIAICIDGLKTLDSKDIVQTMYGLDAKHAFCKRHVEYNMKIFGNTPEVKDIKQKILKMLDTDFSCRPTNKLLSEFIVTTVCVGTNLNGCVKMWERLLEEKDNSILNTLGYKFDKEPSTWLYADPLDLQLAHVWTNINGLAIEESKYKGVANYQIVHKLPNPKKEFWSAGIIG